MITADNQYTLSSSDDQPCKPDQEGHDDSMPFQSGALPARRRSSKEVGVCTAASWSALSAGM